VTSIAEAYEAADAELAGSDEVVEALDEGPISDEGQVGDEGTGSEGSDEPLSYFDIETYGDQLVKIVVDGVEQAVPLRELPNGYIRQAAFTQKTQGLAADRARLTAAESLAAAYERNPVETVRFLAQQQGLTFAEAKAQAEAAGDPEQADSWANEGHVDPRMESLDQRLAAFEQREAIAELDREVTRLGKLYGEDFDPNEVVAHALKLGRTDLEGVFKQIAFDKVYGRKAAVTELEQRTAAETARRTAAKANLGGTVASGASSNGAGSTASAPINSVRQALEAAAAAVDFNFD
jgi:hypothetical protein